MKSSVDAPSIVYELEIENELRVVTGDEKTVSIKLLSGIAEIFGSELEKNTSYTLPPYSSISIYSWKGGIIKLNGKAVKASVTSNSLITISVNMHSYLGDQRIIATSNFKKGPVSLIVGSNQCGKSTFCRFLLNYAAGMRRTPLHIDLDLMRNRSLIPGTISMSKVTEAAHITEGFSKQPSSVYCFGYNHPRENSVLYYSLIKKLGEIFQENLRQEDSSVHASGVIIDTLSWTNKNGYKTIPFTVEVFKVDVIFVISNDKLFKKLRKEVPCNVKTMFIPKQKGVIKYTRKELERIQLNLVHQYFYGTIQNPVTPYVFDVKFSDIEIYSATATGSVNKVVEIKTNIFMISFNHELVDCVLGLSNTDTIDENLLTKSVKGFIYITSIDMEQGVITVKSQQPAPLSSRILIHIHTKIQREEIQALNK